MDQIHRALPDRPWKGVWLFEQTHGRFCTMWTPALRTFIKATRKEACFKTFRSHTIPSELNNLSFTVLQSPYSHPHFVKEKLHDFETPSWEVLDVHYIEWNFWYFKDCTQIYSLIRMFSWGILQCLPGTKGIHYQRVKHAHDFPCPRAAGKINRGCHHCYCNASQSLTEKAEVWSHQYVHIKTNPVNPSICYYINKHCLARPPDVP